MCGMSQQSKAEQWFKHHATEKVVKHKLLADWENYDILRYKCGTRHI